MKEVKSAGLEYSILYCDECTEDRGFLIPMEIAHGVLETLARLSWEIKAKVHEDATTHNTVLVEPEVIH